jgi:hypothetical protein
MADYYPLISRAIANLGPSTPEERRALYERATNALVGQLRNSDPPVSEADITRERLALDEAVRRVESEVAGGVPIVDESHIADIAAPEGPPPPPETSPYDEEGFEEVRRAEDAPYVERPRPPAPKMEHGDRRWLRAAVIGLAIAVVVGLTAGTAIMLKHDASEFTPAQQATVAAEPDRKVQDRLPGDAAEAPAQAPPAARSEPAVPAATGSAGPVSILQRAILVEEAAQEGGELRQTPGKVLWRLDSVSAGSGEPLDAAVRAAVDLGDGLLKVDMLIRRNKDGALPASHTLELKFNSSDKGAGSVRDLGVPEMRTEETQRGTPLAGISVPVTDNLFLIGLSNLPADVGRNLDLLRSRNWFMMPLRFTSGRRAILIFEKGNPGDRAIADALQAWKQQ